MNEPTVGAVYFESRIMCESKHHKSYALGVVLPGRGGQVVPHVSGSPTHRWRAIGADSEWVQLHQSARPADMEVST
ncbi:MAG: hypothetical protein HY318_04910 [Armatimonadetes bacterium]|nr:hypothetical protein [Armatimonadota bacterium]